LHDVILQRYIVNPLLITRRKFDLRVYVAVTCLDPLRVYVYKEGGRVLRPVAAFAWQATAGALQVTVPIGRCASCVARCRLRVVLSHGLHTAGCSGHAPVLIIGSVMGLLVCILDHGSLLSLINTALWVACVVPLHTLTET